MNTRYLHKCILLLASFWGLHSSALTLDGYVDFLYSNMALPDSLDYTRDFYVQNVDCTLRARGEMPWGISVPEREFRNFVLPIRVNNENLDSSRAVFYEELKDRVKGLSMHDAALEVNHWCHEKVTYRPSDARTSSPLASVKTSFGRCGEESTFAVAALRAVCIPARQVYTPRWAHTDDNHAWVEVWIDGKWHFLGACEPEPELDVAWFNAPASRGMLMNANALGCYDGPEEVLDAGRLYTQINVTENYTLTDTARVRVIDIHSNPVSGATVMFMLYNYGEFFPIAKKESDHQGRACLTSGRGDLMVWATDGTKFGFAKTTVGIDGEVYIILNKDKSYEGVTDIDMVPPSIPDGAIVAVGAKEKEVNDMRLAREDSIRMDYMSTFYTLERGVKWALENGYEPEIVAPLLRDSYGNHHTLTSFLGSVSSGRHIQAVELLKSLSSKDLRDVSLDVLQDAMMSNNINHPDQYMYVTNPRVENEMLTPWRRFFHKEIPEQLRNTFRGMPGMWVEWVKENIGVSADGQNPKKLRISPESVWRHRHDIDPLSRDIFFVATARSMGIPARIDPVTMKVQYKHPDSLLGVDLDWVDVDFGDNKDHLDDTAGKTASLKMEFMPVGRIDNPKYYTNFTLSKIESGMPVLLNYAEDTDWNSLSRNPIRVDDGQYMLVTGQRMADGTVLAKTRIFTVNPGNHVNVIPLEIRQDSTGVQVIGSFNSESVYHDLDTGTDRSILSRTGRGYFVLGLISPNHEPSIHALNDLSAVKDKMEEANVPVLLLFGNADAASRFSEKPYTGLPSTVSFGYDIDGAISSEIRSAMKLRGEDIPVFIIADTFNRVVYVVSGYTINLGETLLDIIHKL